MQKSEIPMSKHGKPYRTMVLEGESDVLRLVRAPRLTRTIARMLITLLGLVAVALVVVPWQQNSPAHGRVIAFAPLDRQQTIDAPVEGRVVRWYVKEGDRVEEGAPIADIADIDPELVSRLEREKAAVDARIEAARTRAGAVGDRITSLESSRDSALAAASSRVRMAKDRVRAAEQAIVAAKAAHKTAELNLARQRTLFEEGLSSKRQVELAELEEARARTDQDRADAALSAARSEEAALAADLAKIKNDASASINDASASRATAEAEIASATAELARMEVKLARQLTQSVKAPRSGTVLRVVAKQGGEMIKSGEVLAVMVPDTDEAAVELWVDGNDVNLVTPGRSVRLQFEGWPAIQFSGWPSAAVGTYGGKVAFVDATDDGAGKFRVVVVPDGDEPWPSKQYLRQGTRANAWVLLDRVSLGYELWRQFNGFPPQWPAPSDGTAKEGKNAPNKGDRK
ncbi:HlyD family efflux transporter periplasmic adaptor subunit [Polyangium sp. y55x31]|uniref:HlyD family secretion protein n=1 Tax=Polyangium sp. y55x31 TaxID=3042688 RepID=UPI002482B7CE|nr:HlyD family efflux transporter periplasmic adaptor subunit [Polyangium sp. y55x31]MDI1479824.1 HlyD family efflux transporter periplasmic adaptor subunit [Polyangium sp. y55x31]